MNCASPAASPLVQLRRTQPGDPPHGSPDDPPPFSLPGEHFAAALIWMALGGAGERHPATAAVFAGHGIDLCCGSAKTVEFAAQAHGVGLPRLLAELLQAATGPGDVAG